MEQTCNVMSKVLFGATENSANDWQWLCIPDLERNVRYSLQRSTGRAGSEGDRIGRCSLEPAYLKYALQSPGPDRRSGKSFRVASALGIVIQCGPGLDTC